ncbi:MAG TPA: hypothetical protein PKC30_15660 [Saprospiraceae bacterium]|nr:hypothetical protein [Saprospiraceae bacterium]
MWKIFSLLLLSVFYHPSGNDTPEVEKNEILNKVISYCNENKLEEAFTELENLFDKDYSSPSEIFLYPEINKLRDEPLFRNKLRLLMSKNIRESVISIIDHTEPGDKMTIHGRIVRANGSPVSGATFYFFHTDDKGLYAPEHLRPGHGSTNPRLFGYVRTDAEGKFFVHTIRPASYPGLRNLRHVHFSVTANGCPSGSQFYLDEDPEPTKIQIANADARNFPLLHAQKNIEDTYELKFEWICN